MVKRLAIAALIIASPAFGQGVDPLIGTWKMNVEKLVSSVPFSRSMTITWSGEGQNVTSTAEGVDAEGKPFKIIFQAIYDGMPHPSTGSPNYDSSTFNRIGNTINWVRFRQGKTVEVGQGIVVPGKTYTFSSEGIDANNQPYHIVSVFDRQ
jgi:hypothetical protein